MIDADASPQQRWREVQQAFAKIAVELPSSYPERGYVEDIDDERRLGIWMMPYGGQPGAIEIFLAKLVPDGPLKDYAHEAVSRARELGAEFADKDLEKARLRTWLAWQKAPGAPYGRAIAWGCLSPSSPWADELVAWFRRLYLDRELRAPAPRRTPPRSSGRRRRCRPWPSARRTARSPLR